jgi:Uncharacterized conserved protein
MVPTKTAINKAAPALAVLVLAAMLAGCSVNPGTSGPQQITLYTEDGADKNTVSVSATGTIQAMPDIAYVTAGVVTQNKDCAKAQSDNSAAMNTLMDALKNAGLTEDDIDTIGYSVYPMYDYSEGGKGQIYAYEVTNRVNIAVRDLTRVGEIIDIAAESGANTGYSIRFTLEDEDAYYNDALAAAMQEARGKADTLAAAGGFAVLSVLQVSEGSYSYWPVYEYAAADDAEAYRETPVSAGELDVTATVTVVYGIAGATAE